MAEPTTDVLAPWLNDPTVMEIMVDGYQKAYVDQNGKFQDIVSPFRDDDHLQLYIARLANSYGRKIDENKPMVDMRLADGSRATAVLPPVSSNGPLLVIRKFVKREITMDDLIRLGALTENMAAFLKACVEQHLNIIVAGGTGSGKTTSLNVLANQIPAQERIIVTQDVDELNLSGQRVITLNSKPATSESEAITARDLIQQAVKMRPDRVISSELRGNETLDFINAMNMGHDGCLSSIHATSVRDTLSRLETMLSVAAPTLPLLALREQIASAIDLIILQQRLRDGSRRIIAVTEVQGMVGDSIALQDIFLFREAEISGEDKGQGEFVATGIRPKFAKHLSEAGLAVPDSLFGL